MASNEVHLNNIGTTFRTTVKDDDEVVNLASATTKQIIFLKPDGTRVAKDASFYTDGTDGIIQYTTVSGDLNVAGIWRIQVYCVIGSYEYYSDIGTVKVHPNL